MKKIMFLAAIAVLLSVPTVSYAQSTDNDLPCHAGGQYMGNCSQAYPYFNVLSGDCYSTMAACKQADGDLQDQQGPGNCVRCSK